MSNFDHGSICSDEQLDTICREMCSGVPGARPRHPQLRHDIHNALFTAAKSTTFRTIAADLCDRPSLAIVETVNATRDAWKAYAEHRDICRECWIGIRDNAPPDRGLCQKGAQLRDAAVQS